MKDNRQLTILLVEDNPMDLDLTLRAFKRINCENPIEVARDGAEVMELLETWKNGAPIPGTILLDIKLPKVTGLEVLKVIRDTPLTKNIPIIILTSSTDGSDLRSAYDSGANSYIIKPIDYEKFLEFIELFYNYWVMLNFVPEI
ncbi:MAG: response regulator [Chloroflexi bacterium]|nr:response regulator [Chloroflexota bacterium]